LADQEQGSEFKYHVELTPLAGCPPPAAKQPLGIGYRFATEALTDTKNALPPYKISPARWIGDRRRLCCSVFALSMFSTRDALLRRARAGLLASPCFLKRVGDHYVQLSLKPECGRQTEPSGSGHFDLHGYRGFAFASAVLAHEKMAL
jgi:hypothetical protein